MLLAVVALAAVPGRGGETTSRIRHIEFSDLPPELQRQLAAADIPAPRFAEYVRSIDAETERRVVQGEREHFIAYALQSTRFTNRPPIEPAVSARQFVESLAPPDRTRFVEDADFVPPRGWPAAERARIGDAVAALATVDTTNAHAAARLAYFKPLFAGRDRSLVDDLYADYVRVARFLYKKEFESAGSPAAVAGLYRTRPHSSDTQIEAGFGIYLGLGTVHALEPDRRITRVLIIGPGLDLAPRTDLNEAVAPQMLQPLAVADALLSLALSSETELHIESVDVNPRVVGFANSARQGLTLHLFTGINDTREQPFSDDYRSYLRTLGNAIGTRANPTPAIAAAKRYHRSFAVRDAIARMTTAERLNIITERLADVPRFDLAIITNVLTYFDDRELALALCNIAAMLGPGGYLLHNESRAGLVETAALLQMPAVQMRTAVIAGAPPRPVYDTIWLHQKTRE